ncbi:MAG: hypothetical protein A2Z93_06180 [Curvibacter sp. GWA2_64_110]|nr:MAG: hypothetical protein A2Z93_06180 [Curvibacter sp. GWA2_64_110]HCY15613.1 hypothetical protein [Curvibacter sp.]
MEKVNAKVSLTALSDVLYSGTLYGPGRPAGEKFSAADHEAGQLEKLGVVKREDDSAAQAKADEEAAAAAKVKAKEEAAAVAQALAAEEAAVKAREEAAAKAKKEAAAKAAAAASGKGGKK